MERAEVMLWKENWLTTLTSRMGTVMEAMASGSRENRLNCSGGRAAVRVPGPRVSRATARAETIPTRMTALWRAATAMEPHSPAVLE